MSTANRLTWAVLLLGMIVLAGCSSSKISDGVARANSANIKRVGNLYGSYLAHNAWEGPKDEQNLNRYIHENLSQKKLEMMGIDPQNIDAVFISERDGKPFRVRWGLSVAPLSTVTVVFETEGIDGKKRVATNNGEVREVDDAEYQRLWGEKATPLPIPGPQPEESTSTNGPKQSAVK